MFTIQVLGPVRTQEYKDRKVKLGHKVLKDQLESEDLKATQEMLGHVAIQEKLEHKAVLGRVD
jgi:hypothetical protein